MPQGGSCLTSDIILPSDPEHGQIAWCGHRVEPHGDVIAIATVARGVDLPQSHRKRKGRLMGTAFQMRHLPQCAESNPSDCDAV